MYLIDSRKAPEYIKDVRPQVMNIEIRQTGIDKNLQSAMWKPMDTLNIATPPITQ
ncbi:MAG: hypothetical protein ACLS9K_12175 [Lachnospira eligens]